MFRKFLFLLTAAILLTTGRCIAQDVIIEEEFNNIDGWNIGDLNAENGRDFWGRQNAWGRWVVDAGANGEVVDGEGFYDDNQDAYMIHPIDMRNYNGRAYASFAWSYETEDGPDWVAFQVNSRNGDPGDQNWATLQSGTGDSNGWEEYSEDNGDVIDLSDYVGQRIFIRFFFHSDEQNHNYGSVTVDYIEITATRGGAPVINQPNQQAEFRNQDVNENSAIQQVNFQATDPDNNRVTWAQPQNLPEGSRFVDNGNNTASWNWTPNFNQAADYSFVAIANDGHGGRDEITIRQRVVDVPRAPVISQPSDQDAFRNQDVRENEAIQQVNFRASDPDGGNISWAQPQNLPAGSTFRDIGGGQATWTWTPNWDQGTRDYSFVAIASDGNLTDEITINQRVIGEEPRPTIVQPSDQDAFRNPDVNENAAIQQVNFRATNPEGNNMSWPQPQNLPAGSTFRDIGGGQATWTWTPGWDQGTNDHSFVAIVSCENATDRITINQRVINVNRLPVIDQPGNGDNETIPGEFPDGQPITVNFHANDADNEALIWSISDNGNLPAGAGNMTEAGVFTWTPQNAPPLAYYFTAQVSDGNNPGTDEITVTFSVLNDVKDNERSIPEVLALHKAYPNPFNAITHVSYDIPEPTMVSLKVYDISGKEVATLAHGNHVPNRYAVSWDANGLQGGIYFIRLQTSKGVLTSKVVLVK